MFRATLFLLLSLFSITTLQAADRPNVLFIAVDDLRPELGCYGKSHIHSPNIDRLASQGTVFERAYCMVPTCGASRAALMTSIRPAPKRFVTHLASAEEEVPNITTLNTHFKNAGYTTISNGKVFHHMTDNEKGWSEKPWRPKGPAYKLPESLAAAKTTPKGRGPAYESADVKDDFYNDGKLANKAIKDLQRLKEANQPFFLAVGFLKPHLPFVAPKKYWDLYDPNSIALPETYHRPKNAPDAAIHNSGELRAYAGIPKNGPVSDETALNMIRGYYACVSYTDANIGKLLDELDRLGLADNTIVVLWGDHGWNLGEHTLWCKHSCFETSMHAPLIVKVPGKYAGQKTPALTEFVDIYPSLCELCGLDTPEHCQGESFVRLLKDPTAPGKPFAIGRFGAGDTIRTDNFRYTEYSSNKDGVHAKMLYDHQRDHAEDTNIVGRPMLKENVQQLSEQLNTNKGK
ncbi:iduronate sulfatase [Blastopirellula marina]|uniref:Iduronate sulfatase n=1 Tax=Blastopirellula marina TaxID=124 RepID=A0A2S8G4C4_9BACT|nr:MULTISPECIES: sulfatase [Pirellulaceae]PQO39140.1 iduronate sulfatase [Blastopirellula marina]RCS55448.1 iduronate sulfatase [Bremerella cremea]